MKGKTHDLNHDLTFSADTINCVCHSIRTMFRALGVYNFVLKFDCFIGAISKAIEINSKHFEEFFYIIVKSQNINF